jgi:drug/metabolite transporter (DMT)-like permease
MKTGMKERTSPALLFAAIVVVWFLWGASPVAIRFALDWMPPYIMACTRFALAGTILCIVMTVAGARPTRHMVVNAAICSVLLLLLGNGLMTWTLQYLPIGLSGVLTGMAPIWLTLIEWRWARIPPGRLAIYGMILGLIGTLVLFQPKNLATMPLLPAVTAVIGSIAWAFGSALQRHDPPQHPLLATGIQMLFGSVLFALESLVLGEWSRWQPGAISVSALLGILWLIVVGSLLSYPAYIYTMRHAGAALASTYAYVNPIVTIVFGMLIFHERLTLTQAISGAIILAGVALMVIPSRKGAEPAAASTGSPAAAV